MISTCYWKLVVPLSGYWICLLKHVEWDQDVECFVEPHYGVMHVNDYLHSFWVDNDAAWPTTKNNKLQFYLIFNRGFEVHIYNCGGTRQEWTDFLFWNALPAFASHRGYFVKPWPFHSNWKRQSHHLLLPFYQVVLGCVGPGGEYNRIRWWTIWVIGFIDILSNSCNCVQMFGRDGIRLDGALVRGVGLGICFFYFLIFIFFN